MVKKRNFSPPFSDEEHLFKWKNYLFVLLILFATSSFIWTAHSSLTTTISDRTSVLSEVSGAYSSVKAASSQSILDNRNANKLVQLENERFILDGVIISDGDIVLLKDEILPEDNGIYIYSNGTFTRYKSLNNALQVTEGNTIYVTDGITNGGNTFTMIKNLDNDNRDENIVTGKGLLFKSTAEVVLSLTNSDETISEGSIMVKDSTKTSGISWVESSSLIPDVPDAVEAFVPEYYLLQDIKLNGNSAGSSVFGSWTGSFVTRKFTSIDTLETTLNVVFDNQNGSSGESTFGLNPGSWYIEASAPGYNCSNHQIRLYDITNSLDISYGTSEDTANNAMTRSLLKYTFKLTEFTEMELQHAFRQANNRGLGTTTNLDGTQVYAEIVFVKIA